MSRLRMAGQARTCSDRTAAVTESPRTCWRSWYAWLAGLGDRRCCPERRRVPHSQGRRRAAGRRRCGRVGDSGAGGPRGGVAALVGRSALVIELVDAYHGRVRIGGEVWSARAFAPGQVIPAGAVVDVFEIDGATALVYAEGRA